jgi:hypothetical protein
MVLIVAVNVQAPSAENGTSGSEAQGTFPLRIFDADLRAAMLSARERSRTLDDLLERLCALNAIVFVQWTPALPADVEGATKQQITITPEVRYLHIGIRPAGVNDYLVSVIAHEVRHAIEILESGITEPAAITAYFRRLAGGMTQRIYCTPAAADAGRAVFEELRAAPPSLKTDSSPFGFQ